MVLVGLAFAGATSFGGIAEELTVSQIWKSADGGVFRYRFHAPSTVEDGKSYPLVIFMHGAGERGTNNVAQLVWGCDEIVSWFRNRNEEFYLVAGQVPAGLQWVDTPWTLTEHAMPEWFAAGLPVCGGGDPHQAWRIRKIPIWTFHGDKDGAVPVCRSRKMTAALWNVNGNIRYREYPGAGHNVWSPTYADKGVLDWLFSQRKQD